MVVMASGRVICSLGGMARDVWAILSLEANVEYEIIVSWFR